MYHVIGERGTGKTFKLMKLAQEHNGVFVCQNPQAMKQKALNYGLSGFDIISYKEFYRTFDEIHTSYFIDEIDLFFKALESQVIGYSLTLEEQVK